MFRLTVAVIINLLIATLLLAGESTVSKEVTRGWHATGRYQLFQGQYNTYDLKRQQTSLTSAVFMIDTATGEVKRYINKIDEDGKYIEGWMGTDLMVSDKKK